MGDARRLVVAVDGSAASQEALRWAGALAHRTGAELVAVHAVGLLEVAHDPAASPERWRAELRSRVEGWCRGLSGDGTTCRVELRDGSPLDVVPALVEEVGAGLVVVGSRGVGGTPERALGSTSLHLLRTARVPTLVVPDRPGRPAAVSDPPNVRQVLVGVDGSELSLVALDLAADLAGALGAALTVAQVVESVEAFPLGPETAAAAEGEEEAPDRAAAALEPVVAPVRERGLTVQVRTAEGDPAPTLLAMADEVGADLVVVGTRGRGGPGELLLGSVARAVAGAAVRPTLVVPARA
ncbi:MAG TPA: universal stress protein [Acidimicrobiales bacterium]|nr:universal stress protein [Acidimicrobiales bacterium]